MRSPSTSLLRVTPAPSLLYRPRLWQICQTGKVPAYGTLPAVHRDRQISVYSRSQHRPEKIGHSFPYGQQPRRDKRALTTPVRDGTSSRPRGKGSDRRRQCFAAQRLRRSAQRYGTRVPWRSNALNPGFHGVRSAAQASEALPQASEARPPGIRTRSSAPWRVPVDHARPYSRAAAGRYSTVTGRWSEAVRVCSVSCTRCARRAGTSGPVTRTASMRRRTPCAP